ncbi:MAG: hypothetical protein IKP28_05155 [Clostridia bacterium]|nr:hypothetical protein [Clostridia bacterium]
MNTQDDNILKEKISFKFSMIITLLIIICLGAIISFLPGSIDKEFIEENFLPDSSLFVSEKSELLQYIVLTISFPILFMISYKIINKVTYSKTSKLNVINNIMNSMIMVVLGLIILAIIICGNFAPGINCYIANHNFIAFVFSYAMFVILFQSYIKYKSKITDIIVYGLMYSLFFIFAYLFVLPNFEQDYYMAHHFDAYYYPVYKTLSGLTIGIDFNCIYGYYAYVYSAILSLFQNGDKIYIFSWLVSITALIAFINYSVFLSKFVKNKFLVLAGMLSILYYSVTRPVLVNNSLYFQYVPHRIIFLSIMLLYITIYLKYKTKFPKIVLQIVGFIISAIALFWNLETGLVTAGLWYLFLCYENLYFNSFKDKKTYIQILIHTAMLVLSIVVYVIIVEGISYIRTRTNNASKKFAFWPSYIFRSRF